MPTIKSFYFYFLCLVPLFYLSQYNFNHHILLVLYVANKIALDIPITKEGLFKFCIDFKIGAVDVRLQTKIHFAIPFAKHNSEYYLFLISALEGKFMTNFKQT